MPSSALYQVRTRGAIQTSTLASSAVSGPGTRNRGFAARNRTLTIAGGDFAVGLIAITPTSATVAALATQQLTALVKNAAGDALPETPTSWASSDEAVATVSAAGLVTGVAAGTALITAIYSTGPITSNACTITVP